MTEAHAPRPDKVAKVEEITAKLKGARAVFVTEYRGMSVSQMADLRTPLRAVGAEHKVYKNTLVKLAATNAGLDSLNEYLTGPTALTFATENSVGAGKGVGRCGQGKPAAGHQGGHARRRVDVRRRCQSTGKPAVARRVAGEFRWRTPSTAGQDRTAAQRTAEQVCVRSLCSQSRSRKPKPEHPIFLGSNGPALKLNEKREQHD